MKEGIEQRAEAADESDRIQRRGDAIPVRVVGIRSMIVTITVATENGSMAYTGHVVCRGPGTVDMLLTEPFSMAGRSVQFPVESILGEEKRSASNGSARSVPTS